MIRWWRLGMVALIAGASTAAIYAIWSQPSAPRWLIAISGLLACASAGAMITLAAFAYNVIVDDVRPSLRLRKPAAPVALSHREAALHGRARFRQHPIRFWGVLTLNNRFLFGFMVFAEPEYINLREDVES